jgi:hypothetical protein
LFVECTRVYEHIPRTHFYERLGKLLDLRFVYELTRPLYAEVMGRPSLDPVVFFKCMLIGFFENIVYDTELEYRLADSLTFRKFLGYSLEERTPDESTLRKTRQRMPEEAFRVFVPGTNGWCMTTCWTNARGMGFCGVGDWGQTAHFWMRTRGWTVFRTRSLGAVTKSSCWR